ncbi:DNA ligase [Xaviernesmea oryzae]|uniref:DNA ligase (ATP) n=1 Tax=Xaviernesmea oryzae TaxID=464029 RepID=A0A1Q9AUH7_9HYPH|nr:DNA ligase D [Xaviernesmea oryzae]OLP59105.1 DNA ligase [Xaviernesmea oryzae]SEK86428.1 bifunctional non-homologous end joining protein LigD [Xaviernesmea oryzae]
MALETYRAKRNFERTAEPKGSTRQRASKAKAKSAPAFVIQKHAARRLHYDFRLEMDGVLKSWAVAKGPSLVAGEKRLAVHVEDHPLDYGDFEGTIPKGEYGGGSVIVWDRGRYTPLHDLDAMYRKGHLEFSLEGEKLAGRWHLVRMAGKRGEKRENWLLIKAEDEAARSEDAPDILEEAPDSVLTGRPVEALEGEAPGWSSKTGPIRETPGTKAARKTRRQAKQTATPDAEVGTDRQADPSPLDGLSARDRRKLKPLDLPDFIEPQLATLVAKPPKGGRWLHEVKFDGYRLQARIDQGQTRLLTRSGLDWTERFGPAIGKALAGLTEGSALIDGELVVETGAGSSDFSALQADLSAGRQDRFVYYAFDLFHLDGQDLTDVPLESRKAILERLVQAAEPQGRGEQGAPGLVRFSAHFGEEGGLVLEHACRLSLEGILSKRADGAYHGGRSKDWVKSKCSARQEFVIAGYMPSTAARNAIGSLVLGVYEGDDLVHVGRVGTGFSAATARMLHDRLEELHLPKSPFAQKLPSEAARGVRFCRPELVAEVEFRAWTADGQLRHAAFRGLREDKPASDIVREAEMGEADAAASTGGDHGKAPAEDRNGATGAGKPAAARTSGAAKSRKPTRAPQLAKLTHPDRIYWPDAGVTKEGLADYYVAVWRFIAPFVAGRPLSLLRGPEGIDSATFFQKHAWRGMNKAIDTVPDPQDAKGEPLLMIRDIDGLIGLVQGAALEIHPWGAPVKDLERPDMIIMDLDPGPGVEWAEVIEAAREVKARLEAAGLAAFVKTSGGKGLHVVSPIKPKADWDTAKRFTKAIAEAMAADAPERFVAQVTKSKRKGRILVDYLRNGRGNTAVAPYSSRARPGAPVSMPLGWDELSEAIGPAYFTVDNALSRLNSLDHDPWGEFYKAAAPIPPEKAKSGSKG